jgi:predicted RNA-binding protein YlxR (DUF448 family)
VSEPEPLLDDGPARRRDRRCVASRESRPRESLVRFVIDPEGAVIPDIAGRLPGRGVWLTAERGAISLAVAKGLFAKAARRRVQIAPDLADQVETMLVRRCLDLLGLARRAGQLVAGFDPVAEMLRRGKVALLLAARDGAVDGRRKLRALAGAVPVIEAFDRRELGGAIGRDEVVHVALAEGGLARRLRVECARLAGFRPPLTPELARCAVGSEPGVGTREPS